MTARSDWTTDDWKRYERERKAAWRKANPDKDRQIRATERGNAKRSRVIPVAPTDVQRDAQPAHPYPWKDDEI